jgi:hypothetical protein
MRTGIFSLVPPNPYVISGTSTRKKDDYVSAEGVIFPLHPDPWIKNCISSKRARSLSFL